MLLKEVSREQTGHRSNRNIETTTDAVTCVLVIYYQIFVLCSINTDFGKNKWTKVSEFRTSEQNISHHQPAAVHLFLHVDEIETLDDEDTKGLWYVWFRKMFGEK